MVHSHIVGNDCKNSEIKAVYLWEETMSLCTVQCINTKPTTNFSLKIFANMYIISLSLEMQSIELHTNQWNLNISQLDIVFGNFLFLFTLK